MGKIRELYKHFDNWYLRILERMGLVHGDVTYTTKFPRASFTFRARSRGTPLWILEDMLYHDPYNDDNFILGEQPIIIDLGANLGFFSVLEAMRFPKSRIIAYEAHPVNFDYLRRNIAQNAKEQQIIAIHAAVVGAPKKSVDIFEHDEDVGSHSLIREKSGISDKSQTVPAITFANLLGVHGLTRVDLLKMDIEGGEYDILRHNAHALQMVRYLALEHHRIPGERVEDLKEMIEACGFEVSEHSAHIWHCYNNAFLKK